MRPVMLQHLGVSLCLVGAAASDAAGLATPSSQPTECSAFGTLVRADPPTGEMQHEALHARSIIPCWHHPALLAYLTGLAPASAATALAASMSWGHTPGRELPPSARSSQELGGLQKWAEGVAVVELLLIQLLGSCCPLSASGR